MQTVPCLDSQNLYATAGAHNRLAAAHIEWNLVDVALQVNIVQRGRNVDEALSGDCSFGGGELKSLSLQPSIFTINILLQKGGCCKQELHTQPTTNSIRPDTSTAPPRLQSAPPAADPGSPDAARALSCSPGADLRGTPSASEALDVAVWGAQYYADPVCNTTVCCNSANPFIRRPYGAALRHSAHNSSRCEVSPDTLFASFFVTSRLSQ